MARQTSPLLALIPLLIFYGCASGKAASVAPAPEPETVKITMTPVVRETPALKSVVHDAPAEGISLTGAEPRLLHVTAEGTPKLDGKAWLEGPSGVIAEAPLRFDAAQNRYEASVALSSAQVPPGSYSVSAVLLKEGEEVTSAMTASSVVHVLQAPELPRQEQAKSSAPPAAQPQAPTLPEELMRQVESFRVYFETNDATLQASFQDRLEKLGEQLHPYSAQIRKILVSGHCDSRGTEEHNVDLGKRRAEAVSGVLAKHFAGATIETKSLGFTDPRPPGENAKAWADNRWARIELDLQP